MRSKMAAKLLKTYDLGFRCLRKLSGSQRTDLVVFQGTGIQNVRVNGKINSMSPGYCHMEFSVASADCVVTTLDASATNFSNSCGYVSFGYVNDNGTQVQVTVIITDFLQESKSGNYNFFINGYCEITDLPPLV